MSLPAVALVVAVFLAPTLHPSGWRVMSTPSVNSKPIQLLIRPPCASAAATRAALAKQAPDVADQLAAHADMIADLAVPILALAILARDSPPAVWSRPISIRSELSPLPLAAALNARGVVTAMPVTPEPENPLTFINGHRAIRWLMGRTRPAAMLMRHLSPRL